MSRTPITAALALSAAALASLAGSVQAAHAGYSAVEQCTAVSGTITYTPGLKKAAKPVSAIVNATISGCSGLNGAQAGDGSFTATLAAPAASKTANTETGSYVINWPAASGLNPTVGHMTLAGQPANQFAITGQDQSGAFTGALMNSGWLVTYQTLGAGRQHPILSQSFVNTLPLKILVNFG
jgi:hypothetical protein